MKYFSMFSGIGGFEYGINKAIKAECVGYSEIDKYAIQIYEKHFPEHTNYGDATKIRTDELPGFDLLVGGFPCQAFSVAGKQWGFCDTRGTLFFEISRILSHKRPRYLLLENVKGLLSHDKGKTFQTILEVLTSIGYDLQWQVLNSKDFGVPQNRERIFIVGTLDGHLGGGGRRQVFPIRGGNTEALKKVINGGCDSGNVFSTEGLAVTQKALGGGQGAKTGLYTVPNELKQIGNIDQKGHNRLWGRNNGDCHCIDSNYYKGANELDKGRRTQVAVPVLTPEREKKRQNGRRFKTDGEPAFTLTSQDKHGVYDGYRIRRLTPTECERLQGFPDNWTSGISDTQRYKVLGNAVTTNVVSAVVNRMF